MVLRRDLRSTREEHDVTSPQKQKGNRAERIVVAWLHRFGYTQAHRTRAGFVDDIGDIDGFDNVVIEVKDRKALDLFDWLRQLRRQKAAKDAGLGFVIIKKRGSLDPHDWAYLVDSDTFLNILTRSNWKKPKEETPES